MNDKMIQRAQELHRASNGRRNSLKTLAREFGILVTDADVIMDMVEQGKVPAEPRNWKEEPATKAQIRYIRDLGVALNRKQAQGLTKGRASEIIDSVKRGDGVGTFSGLWFTDGSL